jgi:hypothetical protein
MTGQKRRQPGDTLEAAQRELAGAGRNGRFQHQRRNGRAGAVDRARPLEFDESGFPIAQRSPSFATRVARLLSQ